MSAITINGTSHEVDLRDLYVVRDLMAAIELSQHIQPGTEVATTIEFAEKAREAIERAVVGESPFGERLYLSVILDAIKQMTALVEPVYKQMLDDLTP